MVLYVVMFGAFSGDRVRTNMFAGGSAHGSSRIPPSKLMCSRFRSLEYGLDAVTGVAMPRFLARLPYGAKTNPVEEFNFEEETDSGTHNRYNWANAAYAMSVNITRAFKLYGWCSRIRGIESGGAVEGAPKRSVQGDRLPQAREFEGPPRHVLLLPVGAQEVEVADLDGGGRIQLQELHEGHCVDAAAFGRSLEDKRQGHRPEVFPDVVPEIHVHHGALTHPDKFGHAPIAAASGHIGGACRALSSTLSGSLS